MHALVLDHVKGPGFGMQSKALMGEAPFKNTLSTIVIFKLMLHFLRKELFVKIRILLFIRTLQRFLKLRRNELTT